MEEIEDFERLNFLHYTKPPHLEELKNYIGWGFRRGYINSSDSIYLAIIFLKFKKYINHKH